MPIAVFCLIHINIARLNIGAIRLNREPRRFGPASEPVEELFIPHGNAFTFPLLFNGLSVCFEGMLAQPSRRISYEAEEKTLSFCEMEIE